MLEFKCRQSGPGAHTASLADAGLMEQCFVTSHLGTGILSQFKQNWYLKRMR